MPIKFANQHFSANYSSFIGSVQYLQVIKSYWRVAAIVIKKRRSNINHWSQCIGNIFANAYYNFTEEKLT
jgi:hypothetical protein